MQNKCWQCLRHFGPAFYIAVGIRAHIPRTEFSGYIDPGNWATDIEAGSTFGYALVWVILLSNGVAMMLQALAVRLGLATGQCDNILFILLSLFFTLTVYVWFSMYLCILRHLLLYYCTLFCCCEVMLFLLRGCVYDIEQARI